MLVADIIDVVVGTVIVVGTTVVGSDIEWDPTLEHSLADLFRKNLDDSSTLGYKCYNKGCSALELLSLQFVARL